MKKLMKRISLLLILFSFLSMLTLILVPLIAEENSDFYEAVFNIPVTITWSIASICALLLGAILFLFCCEEKSITKTS